MSRQGVIILVLAFLFAAGCAPPSVVIPTQAPPTSPTELPMTALPTATTALPTVAPPAPATATPAPAATRATSPTIASPPAGQAEMPSATGSETYTSSSLGISFSYLPRQNGQTIKVLEQGDKIYVYPATMEPTAGQWVQVFEKRADESLVDAIKRLIMPGYPAEDCQVVKVDDPTGGNEPSNYEYAGIVVRRAPDEDEEAVLARWRTCPQPYTVVGGIGYFQAGPQDPTRFLFFSIGQYGILAARDVPWQETVRFQ